MIMVWPSGAARATSCVPTTVAAPGLCSTTTGCPRSCCSVVCTMRTSGSMVPPGVKGMMTRTGWVGAQAGCARAMAGSARLARAARRVRRMAAAPDGTPMLRCDRRSSSLSNRRFPRNEHLPPARWAPGAKPRPLGRHFLSECRRRSGRVGFAQQPSMCGQAGTTDRPAVVLQAARCSAISDQIDPSASTSTSISASVWNGDGVKRSRSVPRGTVG